MKKNKPCYTCRTRCSPCVTEIHNGGQLGINVRIEKDSIGPSGVRLTTFVLKYPRFIHSEFMTHRVFSRNASSSRAIPLEKQIEELKKDIAYPIEFRKNQRGMQAAEALSDEDQIKARAFWQFACQNAIESAEKINGLVPEGVHKQYLNRLLEPFAHISVIVTATDFDNFFALRYHDDAQPEIHELAKQMYEQYKNNRPQRLREGQYHLPFVDFQDTSPIEEKIYRSVACCARVSYNNHDGTTPTVEQNKRLYERLLGSQPIHASPAEHQAMAIGDASVQSGNFRGWIQYRKTLNGENIVDFKK